MAMKVWLLIHGEGEWDMYEESVAGVYATKELAEDNRHGSWKVLNKDGRQSFRKGDTRPKTYTFDGCDAIEEFEVIGLER